MNSEILFTTESAQKALAYYEELARAFFQTFNKNPKRFDFLLSFYNGPKNSKGTPSDMVDVIAKGSDLSELQEFLNKNPKYKTK
jgi:hypothetical protein